MSIALRGTYAIEHFRKTRGWVMGMGGFGPNKNFITCKKEKTQVRARGARTDADKVLKVS